MKKVFLHGFASDHHVWEGIHNHFPDSEYPDISFSKNGKIKYPEIREDVILVGWSMGGMIALDMLKKNSDKVKALVLISSSPGFIKSSLFPKGKPAEALSRLEKNILNMDMRTLGDFQKQLFSVKEIRKGYLRDFRKHLAGRFEVSVKTLLSSLSYLKKWKVLPPYPQIPVLVFHGKSDTVIHPSALKSWEKLFPEAEQLLVDAGHAPVITRREFIISKIKDFQ
ncbi:MAG: alpha/beta fold hydrolase [bacterium]